MKKITNIIKKIYILIIPILIIGSFIFTKSMSKTIISQSKKYTAPVNSSFTDVNFYKCVVNAYNNENETNLDYETANLTNEQLASIETVACEEYGSTVSNVDGLNKLVNLKSLSIPNSKFSTIDLSNNTQLTDLYITNNDLTALDVSQNKQLESLYLYNVYMTELNLSENKALKNLSVICGQYNTIDLSENKDLEYLYFSNMPQLQSVNLNNNTKLKTLYLSSNATLNSFNLSNNTQLEELKIYETNINPIALDLTNNVNLKKLTLYESDIASVDISKCTQLTELILVHCFYLGNTDYSKNLNLKKLEIDEMGLSSVNVTKHTSLEELILISNHLANIDISKNTNLKVLYLEDQLLSSLNLNNNSNLEEIYLEKNESLNDVNLEYNTKLKHIEFKNQIIHNINLTNNTQLEYLQLSNNELNNIVIPTSATLNEIILTKNKLKTIDLTNNANVRFVNLLQNELTSIDLSKNTKLYSLNLKGNNLTSIDLTKNTELYSLYISDNQLTELDLTENRKLVSFEAKENNFAANLIFYKKTDINFKRFLGGIKLYNKLRESPSTIESQYQCPDSVCNFSNTGTYQLGVEYQGVSGTINSGNVHVNYTINIIEATSDKYTISDDSDYIITGNDNDDTILANINIPKNDRLTESIESGKYIIKFDDEVIKEFNLVRYGSNVYDMSGNSIVVKNNDIKSFINTIACTGCRAYVSDGTDNLTSGEFESNQTLKIMRDGGLIKEFELKFAVTEIDINKSEINLYLDDINNQVLSAAVLPSYANDKTIIWESNNMNVATVKDGVVVGVSSGSATITAKTPDGEVSDTCEVLVEEFKPRKHIITYKWNDGTQDKTSQEESMPGRNIIKRIDETLYRQGMKFIGWEYNGEVYDLDEELIMPNNDIELVAQYADVSFGMLEYDIGTYNNQKYLAGVTPNTNINDLNNLYLDDEYRIEVYQGETRKTTGIVGTGNIIKVIVNNSENFSIETYTAIVKGDNNGDGVMDVSDISNIYKSIKGRVNLDYSTQIASNVNGDALIDVSDISNMYKVLKGKMGL